MNNKVMINPILLWFIGCLKCFNNVIMTPQFKLVMTLIFMFLSIWFMAYVGARVYFLHDEPWFNNYGNATHAALAGIFANLVLFNIGTNNTRERLFMSILSLVVGIRCLKAIYLDIVEHEAVFYLFVDLFLITGVTYMLVMIAQSIFNKSVSSV